MTKPIHMLILPACLLCLLAAAPSPADEEDDEVDDEVAQRCISTRALRRTEVVDDRNVIFYLSGSTVYRNVLPRLCRGLSRDGRFSYSTSAGRLCNSDSIRILNDSGFGLQEGRSCRLGLFHPITKDDVAAIIEKSRELPKAKPPTLPEPEEVGVEPDESQESSSN